MKLDPSRFESTGNANEQRDVHIASFVVQHRVEAAATIDAYIAAGESCSRKTSGSTMVRTLRPPSKRR